MWASRTRLGLLLRRRSVVTARTFILFLAWVTGLGAGLLVDTGQAGVHKDVGAIIA